jgi:phage FluMu gp28-like protein
MAWLVERSLRGSAGQKRWWVAPVYSQAKMVYQRIKRGLPSQLISTHDTDLWIDLPNGARMEFKSGEKPDNLYGEDVYDAIIDEASRLREEAWHAVRSTLTATRGHIRMIGNVKGRQNWFYRMARIAEAGEPNMYYGKIIAADAVAAGVIAAEEVEDARRHLPDHVFRELYLAEPSDDGGNPFGLAAIKRCVKPLSKLEPKWWGWDLAKKNDWCVGIGLDVNGDACRFERWQRPWMETIEAIKTITGTAVPAFIDSTGVGDPVAEAIQRTHPNIAGYHFTMPSKQQLMEGLAVAIQQGAIAFPDGPIVIELEQFEYELTRIGVRYSAPEGLHDDCVCALALAQRRRAMPVAGQGWLDMAESEIATAAARKKALADENRKPVNVAKHFDN